MTASAYIRWCQPAAEMPKLRDALSKSTSGFQVTVRRRCVMAEVFRKHFGCHAHICQTPVLTSIPE